MRKIVVGVLCITGCLNDVEQGVTVKRVGGPGGAIDMALVLRQP
jgi:hypothetical protein